MTTSFLRKQCAFTHKLLCCYSHSQPWTTATLGRPNLGGTKHICRSFCAVIPGSESCANEKTQGQLGESAKDDSDTFGRMKKPLENPRPLRHDLNFSKSESTVDHVAKRTLSRDRFDKPKIGEGKYKYDKNSRSDGKLGTFQGEPMKLNESVQNYPTLVPRGYRKKGDVIKEFKIRPTFLEDGIRDSKFKFDKKSRSRHYRPETHLEETMKFKESGTNHPFSRSRGDSDKWGVVKEFKNDKKSQSRDYRPETHLEEKMKFKKSGTSHPFSRSRGDSDKWGVVGEFKNDKTSPSRRDYKLETHLDEPMPAGEENVPSDYDTFGTLVENDPKYKKLLTSEMHEEEDSDEKPPSEFKYKRQVDYANDIRNMARSGRLKEALDFLDQLNDEVRLKHDSSHLFCLLISYCGKVGYTQRAFKLFRRMKDRGLKVTPGVLTGLFNSCAECPFPEYGLQKAQELYESMKLKGWHASAISYHAMIKAFGKLGDLKTAFELVDEMRENRQAITNDTFSFLLMACISDKEAGFTHAVSVLRKMRNMKILPSVYNYDLFLRATRDCGIGPTEVAAQLLLGWKGIGRDFLNQGKHLQTAKRLNSGIKETRPIALIEKGTANDGENIDMRPVPSLNDSQEQNLVEIVSVVKMDPDVENRPVDLLLPKPSSGKLLIGLSEVKWPADRLALVGGLRGMMMKYKQASLKPSIKTFTILLGIVPSNRKAEDELLLELDENHVKPDTDFFNVMIKKRRMRNDVVAARNTLTYINKYGLHPDIATFGVLAMTCQTREETQRFLTDMLDCGFRPNIEIYGALMHGACRNMDMKVVLDVMNSMRKGDVKPDPKMLQELEQLKIEAKKMVLDIEDGQRVPEQFQTDYFLDGYKKFSLYYNQWLKSVSVELPQHPWKQYEENIQ